MTEFEMFCLAVFAQRHRDEDATFQPFHAIDPRQEVASRPLTPAAQARAQERFFNLA